MNATKIFFCALLAFGLLSFSHGAMRAGTDEIQIGLIEQQTRIDQLKQSSEKLDQFIDELWLLRRVATDAERLRIDAAIADLQMKGADLKARIDNIARLGLEIQARTCTPNCLVSLSALRIQIDALHAEVTAFVSQNRETIAYVKKKIAIIKRAALAVRKTDERLFTATKLLRQSGKQPESYSGLRDAYQLQEDAKQALVEKKFEKALKTTLKARDLIGETAKDALDSADIASVRDQAVQYYKATNRLIERINAHINPATNPRAAKMLDMARSEQSLARQAADDGKPFVALRHAKEARKIVEGLTAFGAKTTMADERIDRLGQKITEAKNIVASSGNLRAQQILDKALDHFQIAQKLTREGNESAATVHLDIAGKLGARAIDLARGEMPALVNIDREIAKTDAIVAKADALASTPDHKAAITRARELISAARAIKTDPDKCLKLLDKATDISFAIIESAQGNIAPDQLDSQ